jgi:hypothetical protein
MVCILFSCYAENRAAQETDKGDEMTIKTDREEIVSNILTTIQTIIPYEFGKTTYETITEDMKHRSESDWLYLLRGLTNLLLSESRYNKEKEKIRELVDYLKTNKQSAP